jgi:predicted Zn-dependent peptidase
MVMGAAIGASVAKRGNNNSDSAEAAAPAPAPVAATNGVDDQMAQLEKLGQLKDQGILTQEEFDAKKKQILGL